MIWSLFGIALTGVSGVVGYSYFATASGAFNTMAWVFTIYMVFKLFGYIVWRIPKSRVFAPPKFYGTTPVIDREHIPDLIDPDPRKNGGAVLVHGLIAALLTKITNAADEGSIQKFVDAKMTIERRKVAQRFGTIKAEVETLSFEGAIGTIIGFMTFLAQAVGLFKMPTITKESFDAFQLFTELSANSSTIDLYTVMTAFITSLIGWGAKAWLGRFIDDRKSAEMDSLTEVESWIQDEIMAKLHLPSQVSTYLTLAANNELAKPLIEATEKIADVAGELRSAGRANAAIMRTMTEVFGPRFERLAELIGGLDGGTLKMKLVEGGYVLEIKTGEKGGAK